MAHLTAQAPRLDVILGAPFECKRRASGPAAAQNRSVQRSSPIDGAARAAHNGGVSDAEQDSTISKITDRLAARFPTADRHRIERVVDEEYRALDAGRIKTYLPTLVENSARNRLRREQTQPMAAD